MSESGPTVEYDMNYLQAGLIDLEGYLLSQELYWPTGANPPAGERPYPRLTLGNLLLSQKRLATRRLPPAQEVDFRKLNSRLEETRTRWRAAWAAKAQREYRTRLNLWRDFLDDYRKESSTNVDRYSYEIIRRVILELLTPEVDSIPPAEREMLEGLDRMLKAVFVPGAFIWDPELQAGFPELPYWYLYGHLK